MTYRHNHLSASRLSKGQRCKLAFRLQYVDKVPEGPKSRPLKLGSAIHEAVEAGTRAMAKIDDWGSPEGWTGPQRVAQAHLQANWSDLWSEDYGLALEMITAWAESEDLSRTAAVEKKFSLRTGPYDLIGYMDRVDFFPDEHVEVVDYKSGFIIPYRDEFDRLLQVNLYAAAARSLWPWAKRVTVRFAYLRHGISMKAEPTKTRTGAYVEWAAGFGKLLEEGPWPASPGEHCGWCDSRWSCPALTQQPETGQIPAQRELAAALTKVSKKRKDEYDKIIKEQIEAEGGPVRFNGVEYRMHTSTYKTYDIKQLLSALHLATGGQDEAEIAGEILKLDTAKAKAWAKEHGLEDVLERVGKERKSTRLWAKKLEGPSEV